MENLVSAFPENHVLYKVVKAGKENIFQNNYLKEQIKYFEKVKTLTLKVRKKSIQLNWLSKYTQKKDKMFYMVEGKEEIEVFEI